MISDTINKFADEIQRFRNTGEYSYSFNSVGNLSVKPGSDTFSQNFLKIGISGEKYSLDRIISIYSLEFEEFIDRPLKNSVNGTNDILDSTIKTYELRIKELENIHNQSSELNSEILAARDLIVKLRIKLGQGNSPGDFLDKFPYTPKKFV